MPFTVMDLESSWNKQSPGIRIVINESGHAMLEVPFVPGNFHAEDTFGSQRVGLII